MEYTPASSAEPSGSTQDDIGKQQLKGISISNVDSNVTAHNSSNIKNDVTCRIQFDEIPITKTVIIDKYEHVFKKPFPYKALSNKESSRKLSLIENDSVLETENETIDNFDNVDWVPIPIEIVTGDQDGLDIQRVNEKNISESTSGGKILKDNVSIETDTILYEIEKGPTSTAIDSGREQSSNNASHDISQKKETEEQTNKSGDKQPVENADENDTENSLLVERNFPPEQSKRRKVNLFTEDKPPHWYKVKGNVVTPPIIPTNLPKIFEFLPVFGKPESKAMVDDFLQNKVREFVGCDFGDEEYDVISKYCSPDHLRTGNELTMQTKVPIQGLLKTCFVKNGDNAPKFDINDSKLCTIKKFKLRLRQDPNNRYHMKLKYRGVRMLSLQEEDPQTLTAEPDLEPGKDLLYRVRVYRPYAFNFAKERVIRGRHSVLSSDIVLVGRQSLAELRDRIVCRNELDMRVDVSADPDSALAPATTAKEVFPSGFLFINNVFYVDNRNPGRCADHTDKIRAWAAARKLGVFPARDLASTRLDTLVLKLGHPDVYVHQGNCEHVFIFSEIRLLSPTDPLTLSSYPCHTAISQNQTVYCTTCAEYCAKWIVVGCERVPFDPAFFCETCFKLYLYKDGKKIGNFKAYPYRGNELSMLKVK